MFVPRLWSRADGEAMDREGRRIRVSAWGWSDHDRDEAERLARERLGRITARISAGDGFPDRYAYGERPLREEIVEELDGQGRPRPPADPDSRARSARGGVDEPAAIVTRNRYGSLVLNTARMLFLDIDLPPGGAGASIARLFGGKSAQSRALERLREALGAQAAASFRIYRTAAGFRAMCVDREFAPDDVATAQLMQTTGTDPAFITLCKVQKSFRARLTPKPWRCGMKAPPDEFPRADDVRAKFDDWLARYERSSAKHATCRFMESVGTGAPLGAFVALIARHDRATRAEEALALA